jgi:hypothetical protein
MAEKGLRGGGEENKGTSLGVAPRLHSPLKKKKLVSLFGATQEEATSLSTRVTNRESEK